MRARARAMSDPRHVTLLLVEDDDLVRLTVAMMLEDLGFTVLEAIRFI